MLKKHHILREQVNEGNEGGGGPSAEEITRLSQSSSEELENNPVDKPEEEQQEELEETPEEKNARELAEREANGGKTLAEIEQENADANKDFTPSTKWDILKADAEFKMPEGLTKENENDLLKQAVLEKFDIKIEDETNLHPLAKQIQDMAKDNPDITINDLISNVQEDIIDMKGMSDDDKIALDMKLRFGTYDKEKNPKGVTDEDIADYIIKLDKITKNQLVLDIEKNVEAYNKNKVAEFQQKNAEEFEKRYNQALADNDKYIKGIEEKTMNLSTIYGIPVNPELTKSYLDEFKVAITPDKTTGLRGLDNILSDDVLLFKLFVLAAHNGEEKVIEQLTKGRETVKEEIFKKLHLTPIMSGHKEHTEQTLSMEQEVDLLRKPQQ